MISLALIGRSVPEVKLMLNFMVPYSVICDPELRKTIFLYQAWFNLPIPAQSQVVESGQRVL